MQVQRWPAATFYWVHFVYFCAAVVALGLLLWNQGDGRVVEYAHTVVFATTTFHFLTTLACHLGLLCKPRSAFPKVLFPCVDFVWAAAFGATVAEYRRRDTTAAFAANAMIASRAVLADRVTLPLSHGVHARVKWRALGRRQASANPPANRPLVPQP